MNEQDMVEIVKEALGLDEVLGDEARAIRTFAQDGVLSNNAGIVVIMIDGTEFQITVVKSR